MANYGSILDTSYDPRNENIYSLISGYFDNPELIKTKVSNDNSIYMNCIYGLLCNEQRYIVAIIEEDNMPLGTRQRLSDIKWISFQTRTIAEKYPNMRPFSYEQKRGQNYMLPISIIKREDTHCEYRCDQLGDINITLLNGKKSKYEYQPKGNLVSALETFNTIITL